MRTIILFNLIFILLLSGCDRDGGPEYPRLPEYPQVWSEGAGTLFDLHFPDYWHDSTESMLPMNWPGIYQVREARKAGKNDVSPILVRMEAERGGVSSNLFVVILKPQPDIRKASLSEWDLGKQLILEKGVEVAHSNSLSSLPDVEYRGRKYSRSGESWGGRAAELSPDSRWIVVFSYTGDGDYKGNLFGDGDAKLPTKGSIYVDIYDKLQNDFIAKATSRIKYTYKNTAPLIPSALWLDGKYLIIPMDYHFIACLFWKIPAEKQ